MTETIYGFNDPSEDLYSENGIPEKYNNLLLLAEAFAKFLFFSFFIIISLFIIAMGLFTAVVLTEITIAILKRTGSTVTPNLTGDLVIFYFIIATPIIIALILIKNYYKPGSKVNESVIPIMKIKTKKFSPIITDSTYYYIKDGKNILVYAKNELEQPAFILVGHTSAFIDMQLVGDYLLTASNYYRTCGLWDRKNNFKFNRLIFPDYSNNSNPNNSSSYYDYSIRKLQADDNYVYYNIKRVIYQKSLNSNEKPIQILGIKRGELNDFKINQGKAYCSLLTEKPDQLIIEVWNLADNRLLASVEAIIVRYESYETLLLTNKFVIFFSKNKVIIFENNDLFQKIKTIELSDHIMSIQTSKDYFVVLKLKTKRGFNWLAFPPSKESIHTYHIAIYSLANSFEFLKEFKIKGKSPYPTASNPLFDIQTNNLNNNLIVVEKEMIREFNLENFF